MLELVLVLDPDPDPVFKLYESCFGERSSCVAGCAEELSSQLSEKPDVSVWSGFLHWSVAGCGLHVVLLDEGGVGMVPREGSVCFLPLLRASVGCWGSVGGGWWAIRVGRILAPFRGG